MLLLGMLAMPRLLADETWMVVLKDRLAREYGCTAAQVVYVRRLELAGAESFEGRMRCGDGREFSFTQRQPYQKFEIRACDPAVC
jgi:hypothetical protein